MKKLRILLSALLICCLLPVGAGAADTLSQMQLTRQCIAHFQQERPSEGDNEWRIDEFVVSAWSLNEDKDIWELDVSSIMSSSWSCAFEMQTGKIITPLINGQIFKRGEDSLLLENRTDEKYSYQVCDMKGGLRDISIRTTDRLYWQTARDISFPVLRFRKPFEPTAIEPWYSRSCSTVFLTLTAMCCSMSWTMSITIRWGVL